MLRDLVFVMLGGCLDAQKRAPRGDKVISNNLNNKPPCFNSKCEPARPPYHDFEELRFHCIVSNLLNLTQHFPLSSLKGVTKWQKSKKLK